MRKRINFNLRKFKMRNKIVAFIVLATSFSGFVHAQDKIKGKVLDRWNQPISGAQVSVVDNPLVKTTTARDGAFDIDNVGATKIIVDIPERGQQVVDITNSNLQELEIVMAYESESVNRGFGIKQTVAESTAAISKAEAKDINKRSAFNLANSLFGNALGLTSLQKSGAKWEEYPAFSIRGIKTLASNDVLILVDGFERPIDNITIEEVESVFILRDAAAVALYGFRGVNGVIAVETKRGKYNSREINVNFDHGFTRQRSTPNFADSYTYAKALNEALLNDGKSPRYNQNELAAFRDQTHPYLYPNVDWFGETFRNHGVSDIYNINFRGGGSKMRYYTMLNLENNSGFMKEPSPKTSYKTQEAYSKANLRINLDVDITQTTIMKVGLLGILEEFRRPGLNSDNLMDKLYTVPSAAYPVKTEDGIWGGNATWGANMNPVALAHARGFSKGHNRALYADIALTQKLDFLTDGLSATARVGYDNLAKYWEGSIRDYLFASDVADMSTGVPTNIDRFSGGKSGDDASFDRKLDSELRHFNMVGSIDYQNRFGVHGLNSSFIYSYDRAVANGQHNTLFRQNFAGYFHYDFDRRYIAELSLVASGSNRLAKGGKYAFSPTLSAAWVLSNEDFFKASFIDFLKVRASAGIIHADNIPYQNYWNQDFGGGGGYPIDDNFGGGGGLEEGRLPVLNPRKERAKKLNFGVDVSALKGIVFTADAFYERRDNIFVSSDGATSAVIGGKRAYVNAGIVDSYGFETGLTVDKKVGQVDVHLGGKFTLAKNEIKEQLEEARAHDYLRRTGHSVGQIFGLQAIGYFVDQHDIANSPTQQFSEVKPGDVKYKDQNGDGVINSDDEVAIGYNTQVPELYFSFDFGVEWKGFGLSATLQGVGNYSTMLNTKSVYKPLVDNTTVSNHYLENRWTPETPFAKYPRLTTESNENNYRNNTVWLANASYLKLRNCEVYYKFPVEMISKLNMSNAKLYVRGVDLLTFDKLDVGDPENTGVGYPLTKSVHVGFAIGF